MKLGCGIFGVAKELEKDFWGTMKKLAEYGYTAVEPLAAIGNADQIQPGVGVPGWISAILWDKERVLSVQDGLRELGLEISSMHAGLEFAENPLDAIEELVEIADATGIHTFVADLLFDTREKCEAAAELVSKGNRLLRQHDAELLLHNHDTEFTPSDVEGKTWMDIFLELADPDVRLQVDAGWALYAGANPVVFIQKYRERVASIHIKDICAAYHAVPRSGIFAETGTGALPCGTLFELAGELDLIEHGFMVDQDGPTPGHHILDDLKNGAAYFRNCQPRAHVARTIRENLEEKSMPAADTASKDASLAVKLAVFHPDLLDMSAQEGISQDEALIYVKSLGVDAVYLCWPVIQEDPDGMVDHIRAHGLEISGIFDIYDFANYPEDERYKAVIDFVAREGIAHFLAVPGNVDQGERRQQDMETLVTAMKNVCIYAAGKGVQVEMEDSDGDMPNCTEKDMLWFLSRIPGLRLCFDTGNFIYGGTSLEDADALLEKYITNYHMKDRAFTGDTPSCVCSDGRALYNTAVGSGDLPIEDVVKKLKERGYQGYLNIEVIGAENRKKAIADSAGWLKAQLARS